MGEEVRKADLVALLTRAVDNPSFILDRQHLLGILAYVEATCPADCEVTEDQIIEATSAFAADGGRWPSDWIAAGRAVLALVPAVRKRELTELIISKSGSTFTVDQPSLPGSPPVGRATTIEAAIGSWFIGNQTRLGFKILNDESAEKAVSDYRARKVNQR